MNRFEKLGLLLLLLSLWFNIALMLGNVGFSPFVALVLVIGIVLFMFGDKFQKQK
ncbi:MAG: hypothetical protein WCE94_01425 [Candidatus Methanoperedens sp.]